MIQWYKKNSTYVAVVKVASSTVTKGPVSRKAWKLLGPKGKF